VYCEHAENFRPEFHVFTALSIPTAVHRDTQMLLRLLLEIVVDDLSTIQPKRDPSNIINELKTFASLSKTSKNRN
jgi:hypothetical protein